MDRSAGSEGTVAEERDQVFRIQAGALLDENRPLRSEAKILDFTKEAFQIAQQHLTESEILSCVTTWIKENKAGFLVRALENQDTALGEIMEEIERYRHSAVTEDELSISTQKGIRVSLIRRFFSENLEFINVAKEFIEVKDFYELLDKVILPTRCHGKLGGKSAGLFLARKIVEKAPESNPLIRKVKVPKTWYITSDWILHFVHHNDLEDVLSRKYMEIDQIRQEYPHLVALFKNSSFPSELAKGLSLVLDDLGDRPLIVRSSSLLEDRAGSAFSGKYKSLFLGNQGEKGRITTLSGCSTAMTRGARLLRSLAHTRFQKRHLNQVNVLVHTNAAAKIPNRFGRIAAPPHSRQRRHTRVIQPATIPSLTSCSSWRLLITVLLKFKRANSICCG